MTHWKHVEIGLQCIGHPACKKTKWWGSGMVICLERGGDLHIPQPMPLPLTVSCFSKIQIAFTFLVQANPGSTGQRAIKRVCVCVAACSITALYAQLVRDKNRYTCLLITTYLQVFL